MYDNVTTFLLIFGAVFAAVFAAGFLLLAIWLPESPPPARTAESHTLEDSTYA